MSRLLLLLLFAACVWQPLLHAQSPAKPKKERMVELHGEAYDSFTKAPVKAFITLMHAADSSVVDTTTCWSWDRETYYEMKVPARPGAYIIKGTCEGYEDGYVNYNLRHLARNNRFELPRLLMKKKMDDIWREDSLGGVVITGTKVKFAYRGDTLVYNAAAFNLPEGSMLDGLIRQMPGAELKDNGDIYINGRKVDYLTLNGKDFFKGQNQVMLDNLPYFTVSELKVYDKSTKESEMLGVDIEKKDYVMDVQLKRQYNRGLMANAEAGRGTKDRYMGRLFGLYYDDNTRLSVFGTVNNVNENRRPGQDGEWSPSEMPVGLRTTKSAGISFNTEDADKRWEEDLDASVNWNDAENLTRTSSETFATSGDIFRGSSSSSRQKDFRLHVSNMFSLQKPITIWSHVSFDYSDGDRTTSSADSTYRETLTNRSLNSGLNSYRTLSVNGNVGLHKKFEWGDFVSLSLDGSYSRSKPSESFSLADTYYAQNDSTDRRHYFTEGPQWSYSYHASLGYTLQMPGNWFINPNVSYRQSMSDQENMRYRLDRLYSVRSEELGVRSSDVEKTPNSSLLTPNLTWLPSTREALLSVMDERNSSTENLFTRSYAGSLQLTHRSDNGFFRVSLPIERTRERLHYWKAEIDTLARRSYTSFQPSVNFFRWNIKRGLQHATYRMDQRQPSFVSLMPAGDDYNPLSVHINNPGLKASTTHNFSTSFVFNNDSTRRFANIWAGASITQNSFGTRTVYNQQTGAYTYMQDNINGNWNASLGGSYQRPLDPKKRLTLTQQNDVAYTHSVDFDVLYVATRSQQTEQTGANAELKSTVHNLTLSEGLKLEYQKDKLTVSVSGHLDYRLSRSKRDNFQRIDAFDYDYGMNFNYTIPVLKLDVATDIRMFSRRGYYSAMMNDDHLVWNAQLSRSFMKGRLTTRVQAFDLLHELSNTQYNVNAQGRTETWQQCIPRYIMFSVAYKLTQQPHSDKKLKSF